MAKRLVTFRAEGDLIEAFDEWCHDQRLTRSAALIRFMEAPTTRAPLVQRVDGRGRGEVQPRFKGTK
jgi:hypothetical protein